MQVEGAESARERLGAVDRDLLRDWASMQRDDRLLHKGLPLRSDDERATHDEDVVGVQVDVDAIKLEDALHDQHVQPNRAVKQNALTVLDPHRVAGCLQTRDGVALTAPRRAARPEVNVLVRRLRGGCRGANTGNGELDGPQARIGKARNAVRARRAAHLVARGRGE